MLKSTETLIEANLSGKILSSRDLMRVFQGTSMSRYALINKALKKGELTHLKRGMVMLNPKYSAKKISRYYLACQMEPHSYISLESALSYHGWIPEKVTVVTCVVNKGRTRSFNTPLGEFYYKFMPTEPYEFLTGVLRKTIEDQPFLIASPLRALMDYVYEKKLEWQGLAFLTDSLRIDIELLTQIDSAVFNNLKQVYPSERALKFLNKLSMALHHA